jgi:hypothetical protein
MPAHKPSIFIAHVSEESTLALYLQKTISDQFLGTVNVFVDKTSISGGGDWLQALHDALDQADMQIILCSPLSIVRPWVNFEAGAAWLKGIPIFPLCHAGLDPAGLPIPLSLQQGGIIAERATFESLYRRIAEIAGLNAPKPDPKIVEEALAVRVRVSSGAIAPVASAPPAMDALKRQALAGNIQAIGEFGHSGAPDVFETLRRIVENPGDDQARSAAASAMGNLGNRQTVEVLSAVLRGSSHALASTCAAVLGRTRDPAAIPALVEVLRVNADWPAASGCARALGEFAPAHPETICPALIEGLRMGGFVADAARQSLVRYKQAATPFVVSLLTDLEDSHTVQQALEVLRVIPDPAAIPALHALRQLGGSFGTDSVEILRSVERVLHQLDPEAAPAKA